MKILRILPIIGIVLFIYLVVKAGIGNIIRNIINLKLNYFLISFIFVFVIIILQTYKWKIILDKQKIDVGFLWALKIHFISLFYGFVTPGRIGSFIKIAYLKEKTKNIGKSSSSVIIDRVLDMVAVSVMAVVGCLLLSKFVSKFLLWPLIVFFIFSFCLIFFIGKKRSQFFLRIIYKRIIPEKMKEKAKENFHGFYENMPKKRYFILFMLLNLLCWVSVYTALFFTAKAMSIEVPYIYFIFIVPISTLVTEIPITIAGLGTREASLIALLGLFGINSSNIISLSLVSMIIFNVFPSLIGFLFSLKNEKIEIKKNNKVNENERVEIKNKKNKVKTKK